MNPVPCWNPSLCSQAVRRLYFAPSLAPFKVRAVFTFSLRSSCVLTYGNYSACGRARVRALWSHVLARLPSQDASLPGSVTNLVRPQGSVPAPL